MVQDPSHPVDPIAARRWAERPHTQAPWLHEEVARRMAERLDVIRLPVQRWAHWEPVRGGLTGHDRVAAHYPDAACFRVSAQVGKTQTAIKNKANPWWLKWFQPSASGVKAVAAPPPESMQLVWANMLAHQTAEPDALLADWQRALAVDGFVMFSCLGPDSLHELRALYAAQDWPPPAQDFTDMHDWGDQLVAAGFADPVMDMERITLTFETPARLLTELRELGRNLHPGRHVALRTPDWRQRLEGALDERLRPAGGGPLALTFEVIYGHALKAAPRHKVEAQTAISLGDMRGQLRQRNKKLP
ncbi:biotin synthase [Ottowia sp.]|uniref:biotin synthase n=1 Tax=Ottowia sp. TaxID=1898956 RepID=UPI003A88BEEC